MCYTLDTTVSKDYTVTYPADATNAGEKKMTVTGHGNFGGTKELTYTITPCTVVPTITLSQEEYTYGNDEKKPTVTVTVEGRTLVEGKDFEVAYSNNINAEDGAKVTVTAKGNYGFEKQEKFFHIGKADSVIEAAPEAAPFIYDGESHGLVTAGSAKGGTFEYKLGDGSWTKEIPMAQDAAEYTVWYRVVGDRNHKDIVESSVAVTVEKRDIADAKIVLGSSLTYNRKVQEQTVLRVVFDSALNATFDVAGNHATDAGTYTLTVTGTGNFKGTRDIDFTIAKKEVTASVTVGGTYIYNGKEITPTDITVKDGEDIIPDTEYTVKGFENNKDAGMAKVIIANAEGGNYVVNGTGEFRIEKANITVKPKDISKVYGSEPEFELESDSDLITAEQLAAFANSTEFASEGTAKNAKVEAGGYEITAVLTKNETENLILAVSGTGTLTVLPAKLTIQVNDVSRIYGEPNPALSVSYNGFVNGENESALNGTLVLAYSESINETTAVDTYENVTTASGLTSGNYDITYVPGNVTITKIPVRASAGTARRAYLNVVLDKSLEGLTEANFVVKDSKGNVVAVTSVSALPGNTTYSLKGVFEVGEKHTVKVVLSGAAVDATHQMSTDEFEITPICTSGGTSGGSGNSGDSGNSGNGGNGGNGGAVRLPPPSRLRLTPMAEVSLPPKPLQRIPLLRSRRHRPRKALSLQAGIPTRNSKRSMIFPQE